MKKLLNYVFEYVQDLNPVLDRYGNIQEFSPQSKYNKNNTTELHKYGSGTFCRFSIHPKWTGISGVYAIFIDDELVYIGQALDLAQRFNIGYGNISPRNCFVGGQSTNCKMNKVVLESVKDKKIVSVYFHITHNYHEVESKLIQHFNPKYNGTLKSDYEGIYQKGTPETKQTINATGSNKKSGPYKNPSINEIRKYIQDEIANAKKLGKKELIIRSGEIHKKLNMNSAMPSVCSAMRTLDGNYKYEILEEPPKGNGSRLVFKYLL